MTKMSVTKMSQRKMTEMTQQKNRLQEYSMMVDIFQQWK